MDKISYTAFYSLCRMTVLFVKNGDCFKNIPMRPDKFITSAAYKELNQYTLHAASLQNIKSHLQMKVFHLKGRHYLFYSFKTLPGILETQAALTILRQIAAKFNLILSSLPEQKSKMTVLDKKILSAFEF